MKQLKSNSFELISFIKLVMPYVLAYLLLFCASVKAQTTYGNSGSRPWLLSSSASAREAKRFTLHEWLENKDRRALMDMWLSINTPTPYEFVLGGSLQSYDLNTAVAGGPATEQNISGYYGEVSAYARFVGLTLEHQNNTEEGFHDETGLFNLRIFGETVQGSHITLHYGLRTRTAHNGSYRLNQSFPAATLQLYLMKFFGIQGHYRAFSPVTEDFYGETNANELTYGGFIEYGLLRVFGDIYHETQNSKLNNIQTDYERKGTRIGIKLYF